MSDEIPEVATATKDEDLADAALLKAFVQGDAAAMDRLVARYRGPIFGWLMATVRNREMADDLYQDIWLKIIKNAGDFRDTSFRAWLWRIARNHVIDVRRKHRPLLTLDTPVSNDPDDDKTAMRLDQIVDDRPDPGSRTEENADLRAMRRAVLQLPPMYREVVLLRTRGELSFQEVADQMGLPLTTVVSRMHDAIDRLKALLKTGQ